MKRTLLILLLLIPSLCFSGNNSTVTAFNSSIKLPEPCKPANKKGYLGYPDFICSINTDQMAMAIFLPPQECPAQKLSLANSKATLIESTKSETTDKNIWLIEPTESWVEPYKVYSASITNHEICFSISGFSKTVTKNILGQVK